MASVTKAMRAGFAVGFMLAVFSVEPFVEIRGVLAERLEALEAGRGWGGLPGEVLNKHFQDAAAVGDGLQAGFARAGMVADRDRVDFLAETSHFGDHFHLDREAAGPQMRAQLLDGAVIP